MQAPDHDTMSTILAGDIQMNDDIVNVGVVNAPPLRVGVAVLVETYALEYMPTTGKIERPSRLRVYHAADTLVVVQHVEGY